jgi:hypothetical protein
MAHGPHHRVSGHFALGQHAVERLNQTSLNTNEVSFAQKQQELTNTKLFPLEQMQLIPTTQPLRQQQQQQQQPIPLVYQQPLIYEYAQQQLQQQAQPPHMNFFYQHRPQEVIYHQQPIVSMAQLQHQAFLPTTILPSPQPPAIPPQQIEILPQPQQVDLNGNLLQVQTDPSSDNSAATLNQEIAKIKDDQTKSQEVQFEAPIVVRSDNVLPSVEPTIIVQQKSKPVEPYQPQKPQINVQILDQIDSSTPKPVNGHTNSNNNQYLVEDGDQDLLGSTPSAQKEAPSRAFLRHFKKYHDQSPTTVQSFQSTTTRTTPCCRKGNEGSADAIPKQPRPIAGNFLAPVHAGVLLTKEKLDDCIDGHKSIGKTIVEVKKNINVIVTKRPPVFGDRIVIDATASPAPVVTYQQQPTVVPVVTSHQPIFIERSTVAPAVFTHPIVVEKPVDRPVYIKSPPQIVEKIVHQPIVKTIEKPVFIEKIVKQPVEKIVDRPVYIKSPPEIVQQPIVVEKAVIKEIKVPVEKTVYVKSPPETRIVHQPVVKTVEKPVFIERIVKQPYEVEKIVEKFIDRPVEKIVDRPIIQTVEKIVDRPVYQTVEKIVEKPVIQTVERIVDRPVYHTVEKIVDRPVEKIVEKFVEKTVEKPVIQTVEKFIDRPYPVPYAVPFEKHVFHKPDFHVIAKAVPTKHKLFDFDALLRFLTKKEEVKHIYVPATPQHQLTQLNKHQLIAYSTIEPIKESPAVLDYGRYATSHLNPIKPTYGVPSVATTVLKPLAYSNPDPYAGRCFLFSTEEFDLNFTERF